MIGLIINPQSGNGKGKATWKVVHKLIEQQGLSFVYNFTAQSGDATSLARHMIEQQAVDQIIVIGGDGTFHEVSDGIYQSVNHGYRCRLGLIPAGTGNDFAKSYAIPTNPREALQLILEHSSVMMLDLIVNQHTGSYIATNSIGVGFDGHVAKRISESKFKQLTNLLGLGKLSYFLTMFKLFWTYQPTTIWLTIDGIEQEMAHTWFAVTTNVAYFGGGMQICPSAVADDGWLDVVVVQSRTRLRLLPIMIAVYGGKHVGHPAVHMYRGQQVSVRAQEQLYAQADGEAANGTPLHVKIAPAAIPVCVGHRADAI
jgi:diacylglycerol kinase (ATP)